MSYIDGFVVAVPAANKDAYIKHAAEGEPIFKEFGIRRMVETWGDDVPDGKVTDFRRAVQAKPDEVIVFSWFEYPDRAARDASNQKIMSDPRMEKMGATMPFDGKRMVYGGFRAIVDEPASKGMGYVDGSLLAVPAASEAEYRELATRYASVIKEHGATRVIDAWEDDVSDGKVTDFRRAVKAESGEKVVFSWIEWPSKAVRDAAWKKIFADPRMHADKVPYDAGRWVHGGFVPVLDR